MKISTRGRYALRVMIDLAEHRGGFVPLKDVASRQDISQKYLESIMTELSKSGLVDGQHGKGGGYRLNRDPDRYTVGEILRVTEGDLAPVSCLEKNAKVCPRTAECKTLSLWQGLQSVIADYLDGVTLASFVGSGSGDDYVI